MLSSAYRILTDVGAPVIAYYLRRRLEQGREDRERFQERLGVASHPRPPGRLIWCHAASVGEAASFLTIIERLREIHPELTILITTGTVTSARMLDGRLPRGVIHQFVPVDRMKYVKSFLNHWRPQLVLWVESELWPNMLSELRARSVSTLLLNGAMSEASFRSWYRVKGWAKEILGTFALCLTQTEADRERFAALGARPARCIGNLKYAGRPLPVDILELEKLRTATGSRKIWLMASSHRGEEVMALDAHVRLKKQWPDLLTIIVPRHAKRGDEVAERIREAKLRFAQRSKGEDIFSTTEIYLADTMGELGLFYRLSPIMCMGGSFVPVGGHNPIEPAQLDSAILFGPYRHSFLEITAEFAAQDALISLKNQNEISFTVDRLLQSPEARDRLAYSARVLAEHKRGILSQVLDAIEPWLADAKTPQVETN